MILARNYMCSLMMISDMLSKHVGAVKSVLKKWFKINDIQLMHLLVVWYLVNLQDARCNNKDKQYMCYNSLRLSQWWLFRWQSSFAFLSLLEVKCSDVLKEHITSVFGGTELLQVGTDVMQWKMCHLYRMFWGNFAIQTISYNAHALSPHHCCIHLNQFGHAEDGGSAFLWKVATFMRHKPKTRPLFGE